MNVFSQLSACFILCSGGWKDRDLAPLVDLILCDLVRGSGERSRCDGGGATTISIGTEDILVKKK